MPISQEWIIRGADGRVYSTIADYTSEGWSCWRTFFCNVNHECIEHFLEADLQKVLAAGDCVLHDGASVNMSPSTLTLLDVITEGRHNTVAAYSHDLSPVERGFANVWSYIHSHYDPSLYTPIEIINAAFCIYSVSGPLGYKGTFNFIYFLTTHDRG